MDLYPALRSLPAVLNPAYREANVLDDKERTLYMHHWTNAKAGILNGTTLVGAPI